MAPGKVEIVGCVRALDPSPQTRPTLAGPRLSHLFASHHLPPPTSSRRPRVRRASPDKVGPESGRGRRGLGRVQDYDPVDSDWVDPDLKADERSPTGTEDLKGKKEDADGVGPSSHVSPGNRQPLRPLLQRVRVQTPDTSGLLGDPTPTEGRRGGSVGCPSVSPFCTSETSRFAVELPVCRPVSRCRGCRCRS